MLGRILRCAPARLAAGVLAVSLTGAPQLAGAFAEETEHRCTCAAGRGEHRCECPICRARATHARREAEEAKAKPPCHGAPSGVPTPKPAAPGGERRADLPCLTGACGAPDGPRAVVSGLEPFTLPLDCAPAALSPTASPAEPTGAIRTVPRAPDPPPPRA
jgi:hypothetical protein